MSRYISNFRQERLSLPPTDTPITPQREFSEDDAGYWLCDGPKEAREKSLYKIGDVIPFETSRGKIVPAVIIVTGTDYLYTQGYWIPFHNVLPLTAKGEWSKAWFRTWPGMIDRAYEKMRKEKAA